MAKHAKFQYGLAKVDELDIHGEITRNKQNQRDFPQLMVAQAGALAFCAGSHMAETDGHTFSNLNNKRQGAAVQGVWEQLSVKVALVNPDFYGSFPKRLADLHMRLHGTIGARSVEKVKTARSISRLGFQKQGFHRAVAIEDVNIASKLENAGRGDEDKSALTVKRVRVLAEETILKKRARYSYQMNKNFKRIRGQAALYNN